MKHPLFRIMPDPHRRFLCFAACIAIFCSSVAVAQKKRPPAQRALPDAVTPEMLRPNLRFLSSDELEGRETGERGQKVAARFIASMFERAGLKPAGDTGTYLQHFQLYRESAKGICEIGTSGGRASSDTAVWYSSEADVVFTMFGSDTIGAPLVFAGYGIDDSARFNYSDYGGIDVAGKIVLILGGVPRKNDEGGPFSREKNRWQDISVATPSLAKISAARMAGARALLIVPDIGAASLEELSKRTRRRSAFSFLSFNTPRRNPVSMPVAFVSPSLARLLLAPSGETPESLKRRIDSGLTPKSFALPGDRLLRIRTLRPLDTVRTENVVGMLEGMDPALKDEAVVFSAHYDHLGIRPDGTVYNGADDDGSGTSAVIALAEAFARTPRNNKRSLVFLCNTGEEKGLLGSEYYTSHPVVPLDRTECDLNIDMIGRQDSAHIRSGIDEYAYIIGSKRQTPELDDILQRVNRQTVKLALDYKYDAPDDPEHLFERSDHYNFAKHGVPVIFIHTGEHPDYHKPTDDFEKIEFNRMARIATLLYHVGSELATRPGRLRAATKTSGKE